MKYRYFLINKIWKKFLLVDYNKENIKEYILGRKR